MTINATQRFPMDQLLQCGQCGAPMHLEDRPGPVYTCAGSSNQKEPCQAPALRAADLNRHLLGQVMSVIITDSTFHTVREAVGGALAEAGHDATEADELCRNAASVPGMAHDSRTGAGGRRSAGQIHRPDPGRTGNRRDRVQAATARGNSASRHAQTDHQPAGIAASLTPH